MNACRAVLNSKSEKSDARYAGRLDVLTERVDTLAATVATTASALARKDGEIASLKRELEARDETLEALMVRVESAPASVDGEGLQGLREAVAALKAEVSAPARSQEVDELAVKIGLLTERLDTLSASVSTTAAGLASREGELAELRARLEERAGDQQPSDELRAMLTTLRGHVESLDALRGGVTEEELDERLAETDGSLSRLARRVEHLSEKVEAAATRIEQKEHELAALHGRFLESSSRVETIVDDLREALGALPDAGPETLAAHAVRLDANDAATASLMRRLDQLESAPVEERDSALAEQVGRLERRVSTVTEEIGRAKTLWPVALRSLEARLDDVARRQEEHAAEMPPESAGAEGHEDLLAGLRDSLQAMESVAAELARTTDGEAEAAAEPEAPPDVAENELEPDEQEPAAVQEAVGGGARIVPLRQGDP
jgi:chromosome segregation ATPase